MPIGRRARLTGFVAFIAVAWLVVGGACAPKAPPATAPAPAGPPPAATAPAPLPTGTPGPLLAAAPPASPVRDFRAELQQILGAPAFARMQWAIVIQSLATGEIVYSQNPWKLMMPASNMKIVTLATAAQRLGWDFRYETKLVTAAPVTAGVLGGDLIVVGSGDPTIGGRGGSAAQLFEAWADQLKADGVTEIRGRIVADARAFDEEPLGAGWAWDYLASDYAAGVSALQFNESVADVAIQPGPSAGTAALVEVRPIESGLIVEKQVTTAASGEADFDFSRLHGSNRLIVRGSVPVGSKEIVRAAAVDRPALYFVRMLRAALVARGIRVSGEAGEFDDVYATPPTAPTRVLLQHRSAPLAEIARRLMKVSQNQYAETLLRTLGAQSGPGTAAAGQKVVREVLAGWGIPEDAYVLADGSGLSRYNYVSADMLVTILRRLYQDPRHRDPFMTTLPIGGQDGTISRRFVGTRAAGNVHAKTGSIANVRALSGYVTALDGEPFVFSILANNFTVPQATIDAAIDLAVERLANFTRTPGARKPSTN